MSNTAPKGKVNYLIQATIIQLISSKGKVLYELLAQVSSDRLYFTWFSNEKVSYATIM
jgi:hypothetical protein